MIKMVKSQHMTTKSYPQKDHILESPEKENEWNNQDV